MDERDRLYYAHMTARDADREPTTLIVMRVRARDLNRATDDPTPQADAPDWLLDLLSTRRKKDNAATRQHRRAAVTAAIESVDFTAAGDGVHPYAAAALANRVGDFRALVGACNGRTYLLTGGALYLYRIANSTTPSGLTETMIEDAFTEACQVNGYAADHSDWATQLANGIRDGSTAGDPDNWTPANREDPNEQLIREVLDSDNEEQIDALTETFGTGTVAAFRARAQHAAPSQPAPRSAPPATTETKGRAAATITDTEGAPLSAGDALDVPFDGTRTGAPSGFRSTSGRKRVPATSPTHARRFVEFSGWGSSSATVSKLAGSRRGLRHHNDVVYSTPQRHNPHRISARARRICPP